MTPGDVDHVFNHPVGTGRSRATGRKSVYGYTPDGTFIMVVYDTLDDGSLFPVTAFEVPEP